MIDIRDDLPEVIRLHVAYKADAPAALAAYLSGERLPEGASVVGETFAEFASHGRVAGCDCNMIQCVCDAARNHIVGCSYRKALTCAVAIECDCGYDVCPKCDPCTCVKTQ